MKITKKDLIFIYCIVSLFFIFFGPLIFDSLTFYYRDIFRYYHPAKFFAAESIQNGQIPFWNPYNYCGMPFLATLQHALFYPLSLLCYLLPFNLGFKYFFIIHFLLGGIFMYLLCRHLRLDRFSSFISSIIFTFSGYLISTLNLLTTLSAVIWVPLIFLFFSVAIGNGTCERQKIKWYFSLLVGILLSFQFFSGQPDIVFITLQMLGIFLLYKIIILFYTRYRYEKFRDTSHFEPIPQGEKEEREGSCRRRQPNLRQIQKGDYYSLMKMFMPLLVSIICFFLFITIQSIPFKELINYSTRSSGVTFERVTYWSLHPLELIGWVIPSFSRILLAGSKYGIGQLWLRNFYIGILSFVMVVLALKSNKKRIVYFFVILGAIFLSLSLGKFTPFYNFLFRFTPGFSLIRYPVKFMFLINFSLVILAGMGLDYFITGIKENKNFNLFIKSMLGCFLIVSFGFLVLYFKQEQIIKFFKNYVFTKISDNEMTMFKARFPRFIRDYFLMLIFFSANLILFSLVCRRRIKLNKFKYLYFALVFISLSIINYNVEPLVQIKFYQDKGENVWFFKNKNKNDERIYLTSKTHREVINTVNYLGYTYYDGLLNRRAVLLPNSGLPYHIFDAGGYDSMQLIIYNNFMKLIESKSSAMDARLINLLNVKYLISLWDINSSQFKLVRTDYAKIYENCYSLPRVLIIPKAVVITSEREIITKLDSKEFDPSKEVIIESQASSFKPQASGHKIQSLDKKQAKAKITNYESNEVDIEAELTYPGWLVLTDTYYPGWKVYVDGQQGKIYKADYLFRAVYLDSGRHKVKFIYEPTLFKAGVSITLLTILGLGIAGVYYLSCFVRREIAKHDPLTVLIRG